MVTPVFFLPLRHALASSRSFSFLMINVMFLTEKEESSCLENGRGMCYYVIGKIEASKTEVTE